MVRTAGITTHHISGPSYWLLELIWAVTATGDGIWFAEHLSIAVAPWNGLGGAAYMVCCGSCSMYCFAHLLVMLLIPHAVHCKLMELAATRCADGHTALGSFKRGFDKFMKERFMNGC